MEKGYSRDNSKFLSFHDFSPCVHWFTLRFKDDSLEKQYPTKSIKPFSVTIYFRIFLWMLVACVGIRRLQMVILTYYDVPLAIGTLRGECTNFGLFVGAALLEALLYFCRPLRLFRGLFFMSYVYVSIAFASHYTDRNSLFSSTM